MNSLTDDSNINHVEMCQAPTKKRSKEGGKQKKLKRQKVVIDAIENIEDSNVQTEEPSGKVPESPIFIPTLSSPEPDIPESFADTPIQSHANIDLVTFSLLNSVGHLIDRHGISFTEDKKKKVLEFRLPEKAHEMKSFLGLCSQYRDHVPHYAQLSAPLHDMIAGYTKKSDKNYNGQMNFVAHTKRSRAM